MCDQRNKRITQTQTNRNTQNKLSAVGEEGQRRWTAARVGHVPSPVPSRQRSDAVEPVATVHGLKKAERGPHAYQRA
jgi:hypothetical protein